MPIAPGTIDPDRIERAASALPTGVLVVGAVALLGAACAAALGCGCNTRRKR